MEAVYADRQPSRVGAGLGVAASIRGPVIDCTFGWPVESVHAVSNSVVVVFFTRCHPPVLRESKHISYNSRGSA